jgi:hypothetical protein
MYLMGRDQSRFNPYYCEPSERKVSAQGIAGRILLLSMEIATHRANQSLVQNRQPQLLYGGGCNLDSGSTSGVEDI